VQHGHDDLGRRTAFLGVDIHRDAAAIIGDADKAVRLHLDFDPVGVAGERFVHRIVDHLGEQVMQRFLVGAADIHAGAAADRLEPLQHLDILGGVALVELLRQVIEEVGHSLGLYGGAKPAQAGCGIRHNQW